MRCVVCVCVLCIFENKCLYLNPSETKSFEQPTRRTRCVPFFYFFVPGCLISNQKMGERDKHTRSRSFTYLLTCHSVLMDSLFLSLALPAVFILLALCSHCEFPIMCVICSGESVWYNCCIHFSIRWWWNIFCMWKSTRNWDCILKYNCFIWHVSMLTLYVFRVMLFFPIHSRSYENTF